MKASNEFNSSEEYSKYLRTYFAAMAMQGWIACQSENFNSLTEPQNIVSKAVECADLLIAELNKESK